MNPDTQLDLLVSARIFWRYFWRITLFTIVWVFFFNINARWWISYQHYDAAQSVFLSHLLSLIVLIMVFLYGVLIWTGPVINKPIRIRGHSIQIQSVQKAGTPVSPWRRALACWWGFNWRNTFFFILMGSLLATLHLPPLILIILYVPMIFLIGIFSMWWFIFHPMGRVHLILDKIS